MESKTKIPFRYIAGGCFAASAIFYFVNNGLLHHVFNFYTISLVLAFAAIAVGLFLSVPMVSAAGSVLLLISQIVHLFRLIRFDSSFILLIQVLVPAIFALLLLITCLNRRSAKTTGIIAAAIQFILAIITIYFTIYFFFHFGWSRWGRIIQPLLECAGAVFLGFAFSSKPKAIAAAPKVPGVSDTYEKLTHLKGLLDKGIITQEEFDAKKKDILGS